MWHINRVLILLGIYWNFFPSIESGFHSIILSLRELADQVKNFQVLRNLVNDVYFLLPMVGDVRKNRTDG